MAIKITCRLRLAIVKESTRKVKTTNQNQIDLSDMGSGSFILKVTTDNDKTKSFKIIKR